MENDISKKVDAFFAKYKLKTYTQGESIIYPDIDPKWTFYIKEGFVKEYGISIEGIEITIHIFVPGSFFPMTWVISNIKNRYYFEALIDTQIYYAPKEDVLQFLKKNPDVLLSLTDRLLQGMDKLTMRIEGNHSHKAPQKIISSLLYLVRHFSKQKGNKTEIEYQFTHRDIGSLAGVTRETTSRELEKLEKKGFIEYKNQRIIIPDIEKLKMNL